MKKVKFTTKLLGIIALFISRMVLAATPVFTLTPLTPTTIQLSSADVAIVQYRVENQSIKAHTLVMTPMSGVTQITGGDDCANPFVLGSKQSCTLTLQINGNLIPGGIHGGPIVCQQGPGGNPSPFLCSQPSAANSLNISASAVTQFRVTSIANTNGSISPHGAQQVNSGSSLSFTATPDTNFVPYQWIVDGDVAQTGGSVFVLSNITANHHAEVTFTNARVFYSGAQNGNVYYSFNEGSTWIATPSMPSPNNPVNSVFVTDNAVYTGNADGYVYYSMDNGTSWHPTSPPDRSAVNWVFLTNNMLYAATANGRVYYSTDNGAQWNQTSSPDDSAVNSVFAMSDALYAGTANGNVYYSTNNGVNWIAINGQPDDSGVKSIFVSDNTLFVGTVNEFAYSSPALSGGGSWTAFAQTVFSLFVNSFDNTQYAGTQGGYVFSLTEGTELGFVDYSLINSVSVLH